MKIKAFVVVDTNVFVSAINSNISSPFKIFQLIESGNIIPIFDKRMLKEYKEVFSYEKLKKIFSNEIIRDTLYTIIKNGILINNVATTKAFFKDKKDIPFFEVKECSEEFNSILVTGNKKDFPVNDDNILTPQMAIYILEYLDKFVNLDVNYEQIVNELINKNIAMDKYTSGKEILNDIFDG